jgi:hypothetical protein
VVVVVQSVVAASWLGTQLTKLMDQGWAVTPAAEVNPVSLEIGVTVFLWSVLSFDSVH